MEGAGIMARDRNSGGRVTPKGTDDAVGPTGSSSTSRKSNRPDWKAWVLVALILLGLGAGIIGTMVGAATSF